MRMRGLIRWDLVRRDLLRAGVVALLAAVGAVVVAHATGRVRVTASSVVQDVDREGSDNTSVLKSSDSLNTSHPRRSLQAAVTFVEQSDGTYRVQATETLTVAADDPVVEPIRSGSFDVFSSRRLFSMIGLSDNWSFFDGLDSSPMQLSQTPAGVEIVQVQSGRITTPNTQMLSVFPARDTDELHVTISTGDLAIEAVRGVIPTVQSAHYIKATWVRDSDDSLAIAFAPIASHAGVVRAPVTSNAAFTAATAAVPLTLLAMISATTLPTVRRLRGVLAWTFVGIALVQSGPTFTPDGLPTWYFDLKSSLLLVVLPIASYLGLRAVQGADVFAGRFAAFPAATAVGAVLLIVTVLAGPHLSAADTSALVGSVAATALLGAAIGRILNPGAMLLGAALGAVLASGAQLSTLMEPMSSPAIADEGPLILATAGLLWVPAVLVFTWVITKPRSWRTPATATLAPILVFLPIQITPHPHLALGISPVFMNFSALIIVSVFVFLWRIGADASVYADPWSRRLAIAAVMLVYGGQPFRLAAEPVVLAGIAALLLLPHSRVDHAVRLGTVDRSRHTKNVASEIRRRVLRASETDYLHSSRQKLASGELSAHAFRKGFARFQTEGQTTLSATEAALGSPAGETPWRNGVAAGAFGVLLAVPTTVLLDPGMPNLHILRLALTVPGLYSVFSTVLSVFRWAVFAFIYGYFYPRLPGRTAIAKAAALTLAILVPRLADVLVYNPPETGGLVVPALIAAAQCLIFGLSLGLLWETRLARLADVPWTRIRNVRSLKAIAVPATTVSVAAAVAAATALTNYAMAPITNPPKATSSESAPATPHD